MSTPPNTLDQYLTYTPHFELHAAANMSDLEFLTSSDDNSFTTEVQSGGVKGTLLINSRKDAHQLIDNVKYIIDGPFTNPTAMSAPTGEISLEVTEPGSCFFIEKIINRATKLQMKSIQNLTFALKIMFVCRDQDNKPVTISNCVITMILKDSFATFTHMGGVHKLTFTPMYASGHPNNLGDSSHQVARTVAFVHKNITVKGKTVKEAIQSLEQKLNSMYEQICENELDVGQGRKIKYKINIDKSIDGLLSTAVVNTFDKSDDKIFTFDPEHTILEMVKKIVMSSPEIQKMVGDSAIGLQQDHHPGVSIPTYNAKLVPEAGSVGYVVDIGLYKGGEDSNFKGLEFDFYFADPGKNIDILDFSVHMNGLLTYGILGSKGSALYSNADASIPSNPKWKDIYKHDMVHENTVRTKNHLDQKEKVSLGLLEGDIAYPPLNYDNGMIRHAAASVATARLAFNTLGDAHYAIQTGLTFTIRGNYDTLRSDGAPFGMTGGFWVKVNIKNQDGSQFFFTGWYLVKSMTCLFQHGKFIQLLDVIMTDKQQQEGKNV